MSTAKVRLGITFDGEKEVKQAISDINTHLKTLKSEAELVASTFKNQADSEEALTAKAKVLSEQLDTQSKKYDLIKDAVEKAKQNQQDWADAIDKTKSAINDQIDEIQKLSNEYGDSSDKVKEAEEALSKMQNTLEKQEESYRKAANNTEKWQTSLNKADKDIKDTENALEDCTKDLDSFGDEAKDSANDIEKLEKASNGVGDKISSMGVAFGTFIGNIATEALNAAIDKVKEFASSVVDLGSTFEASMSNVQALSGATDEELEQLNEKARELGKSTIYSASEASDALGYMALAGWDTQEMLDGVDGVLTLAAASGSDLAEVSDIITDNLSAFNMTAADSTKMADAMAYAMSKSNTTTEALGEAYSKCAATATNMGFTFEDTSASLMVLANSGVKGSEAGTALNAIMARIGSNTTAQKALKKIGVSAYDSSGNMRSMADICEDVAKATDGMTDSEKNAIVQQIAGTNHLSKFNILLSSCSAESEAAGTSISSYTEQLKNCNGTAQELSDTMNDNLKGDLAELNSAWEDFQLTIYDTQNEALRGMVQSVTNEVIPALNDMISGVEGAGQELVTSLTDIGKQAGEMAGDIVGQFFGDDAGQAITDIVNEVMDAVEQLFPLIEKLGEPIANIIETASKIIDDLLPPVIDIIGEVFDVVSPIVDAVCSIADLISTIIKPVLEGISAVLSPIFDIIGGIATGISAVADWCTSAVEGIEWLLSGCPQVADDFEEVTERAEETHKAVQEDIDAWNDFVEAQTQTTGDNIGALKNCEALKDELDSIVDSNGKVIEGYEARAQYITGQLSEATGVEIQIVDGVIKKYDTLSETIDKAIKEQEVAALQEYYNNILSEYDNNATQLYYDLDQAKQRIEELNNSLSNTSPNTWQYKRLQEQLEEAQQDYKSLSDEVAVYAAVSQESQDLTVAIAENDTAKQNQILQNHTNVVTTENGKQIESNEEAQNSYKTGTEVLEAEIKKQEEAGNEAAVKSLKAEKEKLEKQQQEQEAAYEQQLIDQNKFGLMSGAQWATYYAYVQKQAKQATKDMDKDDQKVAKEFIKNVEKDLEDGKLSTYQAIQKLQEEFNISSTTGEYGKNAGTAFKDGLVDGLNGAVDAVASIVPGIGTTIKQALDIKSPSRVMKKLGKFAGEGFEIGLSDSMGTALDTARIKSNELISTTSAGMLRLNRVVSNSNTANSNRANNQIIYLDSMNRKLSELTSGVQNIYNIDGITYDDGSGVASAIDSLVRAAKIQRRA